MTNTTRPIVTERLDAANKYIVGPGGQHDECHEDECPRCVDPTGRRDPGLRGEGRA